MANSEKFDALVALGSTQYLSTKAGGDTYGSFPLGLNLANLNHYELVGSNGVTSFLINGTPVFTNMVMAPPSGPARLFFGDGTGYANARAEVTALQFTSNVSAVPEPASWLMMIGGLAGVGLALRRRKAILAKA